MSLVKLFLSKLKSIVWKVFVMCNFTLNQLLHSSVESYLISDDRKSYWLQICVCFNKLLILSLTQLNNDRHKNLAVKLLEPVTAKNRMSQCDQIGLFYKISVTKLPIKIDKYLMTFRAILKTSLFQLKRLRLIFGQLWDRFVLLLFVTSGHTADTATVYLQRIKRPQNISTAMF